MFHASALPPLLNFCPGLDNNWLQSCLRLVDTLFHVLQARQLVVPEAGAGAGGQACQDDAGRQVRPNQ
jgi:hypothetical protein